MTGLVEDFRGDVVGSAAGREPSLPLAPEFGRESEVPDLDFHFVVEENVPQFDVPVEDAVPVQILEPVDDLNKVAFGLKLCNSDSVLDKL